MGSSWLDFADYMTQAKARVEREGVEGGDDAEAVVNAELEEGAS